MKEIPSEETWWANCSETDKIRLRLASQLGYKYIVFRGTVEPKSQDFTGSHQSRMEDVVPIPQYTRSLDVINGVEESFNDEDKARYIDALRDVMGMIGSKGTYFDLNHWGVFDLCHATALVRAKAILWMNGGVVQCAAPLDEEEST